MAWTAFAVIAQLWGAAKALDTSKHLADWSTGESSWQQAAFVDQENDLWSQPNFCDTRVLHGSAPLTVLFGISKYWSEIQQRRAATKKAGQPLEVHVLGAAYPFEGRSDWSLLAKRRPMDVPKVRIVLILGTPWQSDNVPVMNATEFDESLSLLQSTVTKNTRMEKPETGVDDGGVGGNLLCQKGSSQTQEDKSFRKADLCRNHGNGLEVVCVEKYYQDVADELPTPDAVAMFSPGFPQIARRSWDEVLRKLLVTDVPIMVSDLFMQEGESIPVAAGAHWKVKRHSMEDGMTLTAMNAYGAQSLGSFRNPFPIWRKNTEESFVVKNGVLQVFRGRHNAKPFVMPSKEKLQRDKEELEGSHLLDHFDDDVNGEEIEKALHISTSTAYDHAMTLLYLPRVRKLVAEQLHEFSGSTLSKLEELGLSKGNREHYKKSKTWELKGWIFIIKHVKGVDGLF